MIQQPDIDTAAERIHYEPSLDNACHLFERASSLWIHLGKVSWTGVWSCGNTQFQIVQWVVNTAIQAYGGADGSWAHELRKWYCVRAKIWAAKYFRYCKLNIISKEILNQMFKINTIIFKRIKCILSLSPVPAESFFNQRKLPSFPSRYCALDMCGPLKARSKGLEFLTKQVFQMAFLMMKIKQDTAKSTSSVQHPQKGICFLFTVASLLSSTVLSQFPFRISKQSQWIFRNLKRSF